MRDIEHHTLSDPTMNDTLLSERVYFPSTAHSLTATTYNREYRIQNTEYRLAMSIAL